MEKPQAEQDARLDEYLASLSQEQVLALEEAALINSSRMQIESYYRLKPNAGPLFDSLRRQLLGEFFRSSATDGNQSLKPFKS